MSLESGKGLMSETADSRQVAVAGHYILKKGRTPTFFLNVSIVSLHTVRLWEMRRGNSPFFGGLNWISFTLVDGPNTSQTDG